MPGIAAFSWPMIVGALVAIWVSGVLRGFTGFGFGLAATPLLALMLPPAVVVPLVLVLQVGSSLVGFRSAAADSDRRSTLLLALSAAITTPIGIWLLQLISISAARLSIAGATLCAVVVLASGMKYEEQHGPGFIVPFGLVGGLLGGLCAMPGPPVLAYYLGTGAAPRTARGSMTLVFLVTGVFGLGFGAAAHLVHVSTLVMALGAAPAMVLGIVAGGHLFERASERLYRPVGICALAVIAASAGIRALA